MNRWSKPASWTGAAALALLLVAPAVVAQETTPGSEPVAACTVPDLVAAVPADRPSPAPATSPDPGAIVSPAASAAPGAGASPDLARGTWAAMARGPFGSEYEPVAWTGTRMVAVDSDTGRTATYRPDLDRWRERSAAPRRFERTAPAVWTGSELVITEIDEDGGRLRGLAYRPAGDHWRELATMALAPDGEPDHALSDAVWTGTHVVVVDALGLLAAYDPAADCWVELGTVPGEPWAWHLYVAGPHLLVESRRWDEPVEMRAFDPANGAWSEPSVGPLGRDASEGGGIPVGGQLVYVTWTSPFGDGAANARFDPDAMTWTAFEHDCGTAASGTVAAGTQLVASNGRRALDGATLACVQLPDPPRALDGTERLVWTGSELIAWSGIRAETPTPRTGGYVLRPPHRAP